MRCPYCNSTQHSVTNTRASGNSIWRLRKCQKCLGTFTSMEKITLGNLKVIKKTKKSERFDRNKIYLGIFRAVNESKWISRDQGRIIAKIVTDTVEQELIKMKKDYVSSKQIGAIVLRVLKLVSNEGYLRFLPYFKKSTS